MAQRTVSTTFWSMQSSETHAVSDLRMQRLRSVLRSNPGWHEQKYPASVLWHWPLAHTPGIVAHSSTSDHNTEHSTHHHLIYMYNDPRYWRFLMRNAVKTGKNKSTENKNSRNVPPSHVYLQGYSDIRFHLAPSQRSTFRLRIILTCTARYKFICIVSYCTAVQ